MNSPRITIVTPSFNQGGFIERTIQSVINQTYKNIQYIVVDGGSTDSTIDVINRYRDKIDILIHEKDNGQSDAINKGFKLADGELVGWINSDDILSENCVAEIVKLYQKDPTGAIFYGSILNFIDEHDEMIRQVNIRVESRKQLITENFDIIQQGSFYKRVYIERIGFLNDRNHYCMDLDLWIRLLELGEIYSYNNSPLASFRMWENSKTCSSQVLFIKEIFSTLRYYGATNMNKTILRLRYLYIKFLIKNLLRI